MTQQRNNHNTRKREVARLQIRRRQQQSLTVTFKMLMSCRTTTSVHRCYLRRPTQFSFAKAAASAVVAFGESWLDMELSCSGRSASQPCFLSLLCGVEGSCAELAERIYQHVMLIILLLDFLFRLDKSFQSAEVEFHK